MRSVIVTAALTAALLSLGCATYPVPTDHLANSLATIRAAQEVGAAAVPQAALHLRLAQEEQSTAKALAADDKNQEADYMTLRATSDAELAMAMAREAAAQTRSAAAAAHEKSTAQDSRATPPTAGSFSATTTTTSTTVPTNGTSK